jgi:hypothetical protein
MYEIEALRRREKFPSSRQEGEGYTETTSGRACHTGTVANQMFLNSVHFLSVVDITLLTCKSNLNYSSDWNITNTANACS